MTRDKKPPTHNIALLCAIRERRRALGLSLLEIGEKAGIGRDLIGSWEQAKVRPTLINFEALVNALGGQLKIEWTEDPCA